MSGAPSCPRHAEKSKLRFGILCFDTFYARLYDARLMLGSWSTMIDPIRLADTGARLSGELPLNGLRRLAEMCLDEQGSVTVNLQFEHDPSNGLRVMHGRITAHAVLLCQRCMERFDVAITSEPRLALLKPGEREDLLEAGDAILIEKPIALGALVEDELLLEVPMVPMHPADQCAVAPAADNEPPGSEPKRSSPFSALTKLKRTDS